MDTGCRGHPCRPARSGPNPSSITGQPSAEKLHCARYPEGKCPAWISRATAPTLYNNLEFQEPPPKMSESNIVLPTLPTGQLMILRLVLVSPLATLAHAAASRLLIPPATPLPTSLP